MFICMIVVRRGFGQLQGRSGRVRVPRARSDVVAPTTVVGVGVVLPQLILSHNQANYGNPRVRRQHVGADRADFHNSLGYEK